MSHSNSVPDQTLPDSLIADYQEHQERCDSLDRESLMDHPHIARVFDGGVTEHGCPFFAIECIRASAAEA